MKRQRRWLAGLALASAAYALILAGCAAGQPVSATEEVVGIVVAVEGEGAANVTGFTLRTAGGLTIDFEVGRLDVGGGGLPAPHLHDHLRDGEPIEVEYVVEGGRHIALRYIDASRSSEGP